MECGWRVFDWLGVVGDGAATISHGLYLQHLDCICVLYRVEGVVCIRHDSGQVSKYTFF